MESKDLTYSKEVPDILPEIKYIDVSDEEYHRIMDLFQPERLSEKTRKGSDSLNTANN